MKIFNSVRPAVLGCLVLGFALGYSGSESASAEDCPACYVGAQVVNQPMPGGLAPLDLLSWLNHSQTGLADSQVRPVSYQNPARTGVSEVAFPNSSGLNFDRAPLVGRQAVNWTDGMDLPGAFIRPWDLPDTGFDPSFITSYYQSGKGFTANPFDVQCSPLGTWNTGFVKTRSVLTI